MRDRRAERPGPGAFHVHMDPLVVPGSLGKLVDLFLGDRGPVTDGDFLAHQGRKLGQGLECFHVLKLETAGTCRAYLSSQRQMACHCSRSFSTRPGATSNTLRPRAAKCT